MKDKKSKKRKPPTKEQIERRIKSNFKRKIVNTFTGAGFHYIPTNDQEMRIGLRTVEVDAMFVYENVWLICEDTVKTSHIKEHIRTKNEAFGEIIKNLESFREELLNRFPDKSDLIEKYSIDRIKVFGLYISKEEIELSKEEQELYPNLCFVQPKTMNYFQWIVQCIRHSARNEIFRFLNIKDSDLGQITSSAMISEIKAPIIYPKAFTGNKHDIRIVSFMMSAEDMLNTCYVLRKDNWSESIWLYQRLIEKKKIKEIRNFLEKKGEAFYNNIIVALPEGISFRDESERLVDINDIGDLEGNCKLLIPRKMNSICVIDGQHRIFAHYESGTTTNQEKTISELRKQLHLLVTGLVFPEGMSEEKRAQIQSEIFVDINTNTKSVPQNVLLQIERIQNPIADKSLAQMVVEGLNKDGVFQNLLQISSLDNGKIKTASIVKFALRYLVTINPQEGKSSLYDYWDGDKAGLENLKTEAIESYAEFCSGVLRTYFGAIKKNLKEQWADDSSKLLSVISINGFIIALNRQLLINGVQSFEFYDEKFQGWNFDFSKENFPYTSSQYRKFSTQILREAFDIEEDVLETI